MTERPLIVIDLDNTFVDYTTAFRECLEQMGYDGYADAPDPSDYSFACSGWFTDENMFLPLHRRAVGLGLYLRERPYPHAPEALDDLRYGGFRIVLATSRYDDQEDTDRWLCGMGFEGGRLDDLAECNTDFVTIVRDRWTARLGWCHMSDKTALGADVTVEDKPDTLDRLMDKDMKVLVKRHAYNQAQCERAEQSGLGFAFDDWAQVPTLAKRLVKENAK